MNDDQPEIALSVHNSGGYDVIQPNFDFIENTLRDSSVGIIYGPPQSGKTFFALHLLCSAALGRSVFGLKVDKREALYVALEGEAGIKARIHAWCSENGVESNPINYALGSMNLFYDSHQDFLIAKIKKLGVRFVVIDTLSMAAIGMDENSAQSISLIINALHRIKDETGACVVAIHHTGKDVKAGMRGHSSLLGNVDTTIEITADNQKAAKGRKGEADTPEEPITTETPRRARVRKQRDGEIGPPLRFGLAAHDTKWTHPRGGYIRSVAVRESAFKDFDVLEADELAANVSREEAALKVLADLRRKNGRILGEPTPEQLRRALKAASWGADLSPGSWRSAWKRIKDSLPVDSNGQIEGVH